MQVNRQFLLSLQKERGMKKKIFAIVLCLFALAAQGQQQVAWQQLLAETMDLEEVSGEDWEELLVRMQGLAEQPADINRMTRDDWERMPFLTPQQIEQLVEYRDRYGALKSMNELRLLTTLDEPRRLLLQQFFCIGDEEGPVFPNLSDMVKKGRHQLMLYGRVPTYSRKGDHGTYAGYSYKHWLRYQFSVGDYVKAGVVGSQDAGEPFFSNKNTMGYDFYSFYLQLNHWRRVETLIVGKYKLSAGMGLVVNNGFSLGKLATLSQLGRTVKTVRPHSSRTSADYFQGAAATVRLSHGLAATGFVSYRPMDATLNLDSTARTLVTDGYHRTVAELAKKNNTHVAEAGMNIAYRYKRFQIGATTLYTHLDRDLRPATKTLYRRYYLQGNNFLSSSINYSYYSKLLTIGGETAISQEGALATLNTASVSWDGLSIMALQRFYSYRYAALHARSFSNGGTVQNESGLYVGLTWTPSPRWRLMAYTDYSYSPWARYNISLSSHAWDHLLQLQHYVGVWTLGARYRLRQRQRDQAGTKQLEDYNLHTGRLWADWHAGDTWTGHTQVDFSCAATDDYGRMVSQTLQYQRGAMRLSMGGSYFRTDSYNSRIYSYEQGPLYTFGSNQFSGEGLRYWLMARWQPIAQLMLTVKVATTNYLDRSVISSGNQQIDHSSMTDIDLQAKWRF